MDRREFIAGGVAACALASFADVTADSEPVAGIKVRFLGTGAAGGANSFRKCSSVLLDDKVLIDLTSLVLDKIPEGVRPEVIFQTHSHGDHYDPATIVKLGVKRMYVQETWAAAAKADVARIAEKLKLPAPEVIALPFGKKIEECGLSFTGVPANHATSRVTDGVLERASLYLVEKGKTRLLYATDTAGIPADAARMVGIDAHVNPDNVKGRYAGNPFVHEPQAITALIMEATDGLEDSDFRMFTHSSVQLVKRTIKGLRQYDKYCPPEGQSAYLTHLALRYREWPSEKIDAELPTGMKAAYDGLEIVFR